MAASAAEERTELEERSLGDAARLGSQWGRSWHSSYIVAAVERSGQDIVQRSGHCATVEERSGAKDNHLRLKWSRSWHGSCRGAKHPYEELCGGRRRGRVQATVLRSEPATTSYVDRGRRQGKFKKQRICVIPSNFLAVLRTMPVPESQLMIAPV